MRPHVAFLNGHVHTVLPHHDGYAVRCGGGLEILDTKLARRALIEGGEGTRLVELTPKTFLLHGERFSTLWEGTLGGTFTKVDLGEGYVYSVARTPSGFHAFHSDGVLVDHANTQTQVVPTNRFSHGGCAWRGGSVTAGHDGIAILAADGTIVATGDASLHGAPCALDDAIAVRTIDALALFDGEAREVARIPRSLNAGVERFGDGMLVRIIDDDQTELSYWGTDGTERWSRVFEGHWQDPVVVGAWIVVASYDKNVVVLDAEGNELAEIPTPSFAQEVCAFRDGVAIYVRDHADVLWWRPGQDIVKLPHDDQPNGVWAVPAGLVTAEGSALFLWNPDEDGPEWTPVETTLPMNTPIVMSGNIITLVSRGRLALRGQWTNGKTTRIPPDAGYRPVTTRDEAARLLEKLITRSFDGPLPELPDDKIVYDVAAKLGALPLAQTVDLYGRTLFAASSLPAEVRQRASWGRQRFFEELAFALGTSARSLLAAVKARKVKLEPPRPVPGYDYLGSFTSSGDLVVSDPCYRGKKSGGFSLTVKIAGHEGTWHAFANTTRKGIFGDDRNGELVVIHDDGFEVHANEEAGTIGVDSGTAGVYDKKCPVRDNDEAFEEGTFAALGVTVWSGDGDGGYPVYVGKHKGRVAKIRVHFIGDDPEIDRSVAKSTAPAKPYSAKTLFAMGDTIEHVKFGTGQVIRIGGDGKIDVRFDDGTRTLIHGKK